MNRNILNDGFMKTKGLVRIILDLAGLLLLNHGMIRADEKGTKNHLENIKTNEDSLRAFFRKSQKAKIFIHI